MRKILKARKGGFTLVELLIVIMIIAILAGMMMLSMGSATALAEATKIITDLRVAKAAAVFVYVDSGLNWDWAKETSNVAAAKSLDQYSDRPMFGTNNTDGEYGLHFISADLDGTGGRGERTLIGLAPLKGRLTSDVKTQLQKNAAKVGLYKGDDNDGTLYDGGDVVYSPLF